MWRKLRSALFIDFENVGGRLAPAALAAMTAWLEDGKFEEAGRKRTLITKRVYWNSSAERHRDAFEAAGFEVVLCEKFSAMKNGADIRMALDVLDTCWRAPDIKEYILFTTDSDFVPVLQRLTEKSKLSAILVNEATMVSHTAFSIYADLVVPVRELMSEGLTYARPAKGGWLQGLWKRPRNGSTPEPRAPPAGTEKPPQAPGADPGKSRPTVDQTPLAQAERAVLRAISQTPKKFVSRKAIEGQLQQVKGFKKTGPNAYLGKKHYQGLMLEVARINKAHQGADGPQQQRLGHVRSGGAVSVTANRSSAKAGWSASRCIGSHGGRVPGTDVLSARRTALLCGLVATHEANAKAAGRFGMIPP